MIHVDYTLGVDQKYPRAVQDGCCVYDWLIQRGVPGRQIFLIGESGGGGLAACVMLALRDRPAFLGKVSPHSFTGSARPAGLILMSPMIDLGHDYPYDAKLESFDLIPGALARGCARNYCPREETSSPYATPINAANLGALPPILIQTGALEIFEPACALFAQKCSQHGTTVLYDSYEGMVHCFQILASFGCPHAAKAYQNIFLFIENHACEASNTILPLNV